MSFPEILRHSQVEWNNTQQWWKFESESEKNRVVERGDESWLLSGMLCLELGVIVDVNLNRWHLNQMALIDRKIVTLTNADAFDF